MQSAGQLVSKLLIGIGIVMNCKVYILATSPFSVVPCLMCPEMIEDGLDPVGVVDSLMVRSGFHMEDQRRFGGLP